MAQLRPQNLIDLLGFQTSRVLSMGNNTLYWGTEYENHALEYGGLELALRCTQFHVSSNSIILLWVLKFVGGIPEIGRLPIRHNSKNTVEPLYKDLHP